MDMREKIDGILDNTVPNWRFEHELIKNECLDQILSLMKVKLRGLTDRELKDVPIDNYRSLHDQREVAKAQRSLDAKALEELGFEVIKEE